MSPSPAGGSSANWLFWCAINLGAGMHIASSFTGFGQHPMVFIAICAAVFSLMMIVWLIILICVDLILIVDDIMEENRETSRNRPSRQKTLPRLTILSGVLLCILTAQTADAQQAEAVVTMTGPCVTHEGSSVDTQSAIRGGFCATAMQSLEENQKGRQYTLHMGSAAMRNGITGNEGVSAGTLPPVSRYASPGRMDGNPRTVNPTYPGPYTIDEVQQ